MRAMVFSAVLVTGLGLAAQASAQTSAGARPAGSPLKPAASSAPTLGPSARPPATAPTTRPSTFPRPSATAPVVDGTIDDDTPPVTSGARSSFGSRFQPVVEPSDEETVEHTPAPAPRTFSTPAGSSTPPAGRFTPTASPAAAPTSPRTFTPSASSSTAPRNSLPATTRSDTTRSVTSGSRIASATPVSTPAEAASPVAEALLSQMLQKRAQHELPGQPMPLSQSLDRVGSGESRILTVQTYWKLVHKVAAYHATIDDRQLFAQINSRQLAQHDRAALHAAQLGAEAAVHRAELEFVIAQHELAEAAHFTDVDLQALPSDVPLVSEYRTHFNALYGSGAAPSGLRRIDRAIPYHLKDVRSRADAVVAAQSAVQSTAQAVNSGEAGVAALLETHQHLVRERTAFVISVFDYNAMIAEYALHVAPNQPPATVVAMLIKTKQPQTTPTSRPTNIARAPVSRTSAESPIGADSAPDLNSTEPPHEQYQPQEAFAAPRQPLRYAMPEETAPADASEEGIYRR